MLNRRRFVLAIVAAGFCFALFFAIEGFLEWWRLGRPGMEATSWAGTNNTKLVDTLSPMARAYNNILAMLIATIGLAIPLTANMHTPKLIDMFLRDRVNQIVLVGGAFGAANVLFVAYLVGPAFAPVWAYRFAVYGALAGWAVLIPYFFYVVRFLDPSNILARLKVEVIREIDRAGRAGVDLEGSQDVVHERLNQIGTLILKSIDRGDRGVAREGLWSLKQILDHYYTRKKALPDRWYAVDRKDFVGFAAEAIDLINEERIWFEHKVVKQMYVAYQAALAKSPDAVSSISDATRVVAREAAELGDERAVRLMVRFFNTYLREALKRKETYALYDVFYQYRLLAREAARGWPALLREIGRHFRHYATMAVDSGMPFVFHLAGFDLGWLVRRAYEDGNAAAGDLLDEVLAFDHHAGGRVQELLVKAKIALGGFFVETGRPAEAARVRENLAALPRPALTKLGQELLAVTDRCFWEVTARQINFEWMAPERREKIRAFLAECGA